MHSFGVIESFFLIFAGAAVVATAALYTRQPLLVAYIIVGCALGPHGLKLVPDPFDEFGVELAVQLREKRSDVSEVVAVTQFTYQPPALSEVFREAVVP